MLDTLCKEKQNKTQLIPRFKFRILKAADQSVNLFNYKRTSKH